MTRIVSLEKPSFGCPSGARNGAAKGPGEVQAEGGGGRLAPSERERGRSTDEQGSTSPQCNSFSISSNTSAKSNHLGCSSNTASTPGGVHPFLQLGFSSSFFFFSFFVGGGLGRGLEGPATGIAPRD